MLSHYAAALKYFWVIVAPATESLESGEYEDNLHVDVVNFRLKQTKIAKLQNKIQQSVETRCDGSKQSDTTTGNWFKMFLKTQQTVIFFAMGKKNL